MNPIGGGHASLEGASAAQAQIIASEPRTAVGVRNERMRVQTDAMPRSNCAVGVSIALILNVCRGSRMSRRSLKSHNLVVVLLLYKK